MWKGRSSTGCCGVRDKVSAAKSGPTRVREDCLLSDFSHVGWDHDQGQSLSERGRSFAAERGWETTHTPSGWSTPDGRVGLPALGFLIIIINICLYWCQRGREYRRKNQGFTHHKESLWHHIPFYKGSESAPPFGLIHEREREREGCNVATLLRASWRGKGTTKLDVMKTL